MKFVLTFDCDNDAFAGDAESEVMAILNRIRNAVAEGRRTGTVFDTNGNRIGEYAFVGTPDGSGE
jgi:hypothetical protein